MTASSATTAWLQTDDTLSTTSRYHVAHPAAPHVLSGQETRTLRPDDSWEVVIEQEGVTVRVSGDASESFASAQRRIDAAKCQAAYPFCDSISEADEIPGQR